MSSNDDADRMSFSWSLPRYEESFWEGWDQARELLENERFDMLEGLQASIDRLDRFLSAEHEINVGGETEWEKIFRSAPDGDEREEARRYLIQFRGLVADAKWDRMRLANRRRGLLQALREHFETGKIPSREDLTEERREEIAPHRIDGTPAEYARVFVDVYDRAGGRLGGKIKQVSDLEAAAQALQPYAAGSTRSWANNLIQVRRGIHGQWSRGDVHSLVDAMRLALGDERNSRSTKKHG